MSDGFKRDTFKKATKMGSFNNWLTSLPDEDLAYLSQITDQINDGNPKDEDTFGQMVALVIHFSGRGELSEQELEDMFGSLTVMLACESNVREGKMTRTGAYSLVEGEDSASFKMTDKGFKSVEDMLKDKS